MKELMTMGKQRWSYELVKEFTENNSNCTLLSTEFKTAKSNLVFKCECTNDFITTFERFRLRDKRQCNDCGFKNQLDKQSLSFSEVKQYVKENSESILLSEQYVNTKEKLRLKCRCGEIFYKSFEKFKSKSKTCKKCSYEDISKSQLFSYDFVRKYIESKGCRLIDSDYINCESKISVECFCETNYSTTFTDFKNFNHIRCRKCTNQMSKGEILIEEYLNNSNLLFELQYTFEDLKADNARHLLKFDFAIFNDNNITLVEFDGKQHYIPVDYFGGIDAFKVLQSNDARKNEYCTLNNINLIRIPYYEINNIEKILNTTLNLNQDNTVPSLTAS
jgi:hypothetical protein